MLKRTCTLFPQLGLTRLCENEKNFVLWTEQIQYFYLRHYILVC